MSFTLPDLVIEGAVRKGFDFLRNNAGTPPGGFTNETDVTLIMNSPGNEVFDGNPTGGGNSINGVLRIPNVMSATVSGGVLTFTRTDDIIYTLTFGATYSSTRAGGVNITISGAFNSNGTPTVDTGNILRIPFILTETTGTSLGTYAQNIATSGDTVSWTIPGSKEIKETIGAGGEVLDMLFNFETGSDTADGGLDASVSSKYSAESFRLRKFFRENQVAIVQSFSDVQANLPCISIQLANDGEDQGLALTDDFGGIDGTFGSEVPAKDRIGRDENTIHANTTVNVGIHTKEQLLTKYLYNITKYFILSAKEDLIRQNFIIATFRGSDFTRDASWQGDHVYTRFLNISGKTEDSWVNLDEIVVQLEEVGVEIFVPQDGTNNTFVNGSSIFSNITPSSAQLQLPGSVYFPAVGRAVLIQRDGTGASLFQSAAFDYTNNPTTGILSGIDLTGETMNFVNVPPEMGNPLSPTAVERTVEVRDLATGQTVPVSGVTPTITTPPASGLVEGQARQNINDAGDVLHRSNINEGTI